MEAKWEGDYDRAIALFTRAIELDPSDVFAYDERGWTKLAKGDHKEAVPDFTRAIELDPTWHWAYGGRGQAQRLEGYHDGAILDFTRAIELEPSYAFAYTERGYARFAQGDYDGATADYARAIELDPSYQWAYDGLSAVAWFRATTADPQLRDSAGAVELARKAVAFAPTSANFRNTLGAALYRAGQDEEALEALETSMDLSGGGDAFDWFLMAMVRQKLGKADARVWFDRAVAWAYEHKPDDEELLRFRAEAEEVLGLRPDLEHPAESPDGD
jgi:tetratricopeptide (TPR) repeat protein